MRLNYKDLNIERFGSTILSDSIEIKNGNSGVNPQQPGSILLTDGGSILLTTGDQLLLTTQTD